MSTPLGGKKSASSSNSSMVNTPAGTPVGMPNGGGGGGGALMHHHSPPPNNAPKYGTLVPNRVFVGGISANTTETELLHLFSNYGTVKAAKIIQDRAGVSRGYGFITFESEDDAKRLQREADNIVLRERKLNIAPAIKKQPFGRAFDAASPPALLPAYAAPPAAFFPPASMPFFQGGVAYYAPPPPGGAQPPDAPTQPPSAVYQPPSGVYAPQSAPPPPPPPAAPYQPMMFPPQPIYMPQQYPMPMPYEFNYYPNGGAPPYLVPGAGGGGAPAGGAPAQPTAPLPPSMGGQRTLSPPQAAFGAPMAATSGGGYANADALYFNMPIGFMDAGAIFSEQQPPMDAMANGVAMPEDFAAGDAVVMTPPPAPAPPPPPSAGAAHPLATPPPPPAADTHRQTTTPVVSLLSLDHQQEKDVLSMRGGRRPKTAPTTATLIASPYLQQQAPPPPLPPPAPSNGYAAYQLPSYEYGAERGTGGGGWRRYWRSGNSHPHPHPQPHHDVAQRRAADTAPTWSVCGEASASPPAPSGYHQQQQRAVAGYATAAPPPPPPRPAPVFYPRRTFSANRGAGYRGATYQPAGDAHVPAANAHLGPQMAPPPPPPPQHFVAPARHRPRRSVRRNGPTSLAECGAGDAPASTPADGVADACSKMDGLKL